MEASAICTPPPKRKKGEAATLATSNFPGARAAVVASTSQIYDFDSDEESRPQTSTPKARAPSPPLPQLSLRDVQRLIREAVQPLRDELSQLHAQLQQKCNCDCKEQLHEAQRDVLELQRQQRDLKFNLQAVEASQANRATKKKADNHANEILTDFDVEKVHQFDSEIPAYHLDQDVLARIKRNSLTTRVVIANLGRQMFSMKERARDCNISGGKNKEMLSPQKSRFEKVCSYASALCNEEATPQFVSQCKVVIDESNRKYREDLKKLKSKKNVNTSSIVEPENSE